MAHAKSTDPNVFILPDLGEGVHEAELISWKVKPGDHVDEHDVVAEMETDKALVEVPSPRAGVIKELFGEVGDILKVGEPAWTYEGAGGGDAPAEQPARTEPKASQAETAAAEKHLDGPHQNGRSAPSEPPADDADDDAGASEEEREDAGTVVGTMGGELKGVSSAGGKALATPAVRRLARDLGVDIDSVRGTGLAGRVTEKDVRGAAGSGARSASGGAGEAPARPGPEPAPARQPGRAPAAARDADAHQQTPHQHAPAQRSDSLATTVSRQQDVVAPRPATLVPAADASRVPMRGVRRTIAARLRQSVDRAVHFTVMDDADASALDDVRRRVASASGEKVSYLPFVASAAMRALRDFPALNAHIDDDAEEIIRHPSVHLGVAADTPQGLSVPVIPSADMLGVLELARHISDVAAAVRDRSIPSDRLKGSTFTISNVGAYAGKYATPIINYPEVSILAAGRVYDGVVADRGAIRVAKLLPLSLTCDHRCVDGAEAARCLARIIELLKQPESLLTPARLA